MKKNKSKTTIRDIEREYKIDFGVSGDMNLSTYLKNQGLLSLSRFLKKIESRPSI